MFGLIIGLVGGVFVGMKYGDDIIDKWAKFNERFKD